MNDNDITTPIITEAMREEARNEAKEWIYVIDSEYAPDGAYGAVPIEGVQGAFPVTPEGEIVEEFTANPHYHELSPADAIAKLQKRM